MTSNSSSVPTVKRAEEHAAGSERLLPRDEDSLPPLLSDPAIGHHPVRLARSLGLLGVSKFSGILLLLAFIATYSLWMPDTFLTTGTFSLILSTQAIAGLLGIAVLFPLAAGVFDLSAAANLGFSSVLCGALMADHHLSPTVAVLITLLAGVLIGVVNGGLIAGIGLDSFMATLGTTSLLGAGTAVLADSRFIGPFPKSFTRLASPSPLGIPIVAYYLFGLAVLAWYVLEHTPVGRRVHAVGANAEAARLAGVGTRRIIFVQLVVCATLASLAGVILSAQLNSTNSLIGGSYLLPAYAAAFLGTTQVKPGRFNVWGTIVAILLLGTGIQGLQLAGASTWVTDLFNGVALIGAVSVAVIASRMTVRRGAGRGQATS